MILIHFQTEMAIIVDVRAISQTAGNSSPRTHAPLNFDRMHWLYMYRDVSRQNQQMISISLARAGPKDGAGCIFSQKSDP